MSITGLLLAGFIIGSLGVLNDVTVTQASTAFELAEHGDGSSRRGIFLGAMRVGRDHIASTVYTLVLAYAGSALPLLLLFSVANRSLGDVLTSETRRHRDRPVRRRRYRAGAVGAADHRDRGRPRHARRSEDRARQPVKSSSVSSVAASAEARSACRNTDVT